MRNNDMWLRQGGAVVFGVGLVCLGTGCPLLEVEVEVQEVCLTYADIAVEGVPAELAGAFHKSFAFDDLASIQDLADLDADLEFVRVELRAKSGIASFDFVDSARITIASGDPESDLPVMPVFDCADGSCAALGASLDIPAGAQQDALAYVESGSILVDLELAGVLPTSAWTLDVDVCVKGRVAVGF